MNDSKIMIAVSLHLRTIVQVVDKALEKVAGVRVPFAVIVYTNPRASYASNASREDSRAALRELLEHWDKATPDVPAHEVQ